MKCPRCQQENPTGSSFCLECGARLGLTCGSCGTDLPAGSKFCNKCGTAVSSPVARQPRFASPETYTPRHLAEKILTSKSALEGERKQVTVLFADLKGSMELLADRDPEEARKLLDPVLQLMMDAVHRYEGTVNQVMGDGIMALFGAPLAHEDHAVRACYAALRMQESLTQYADEVFRSHGVPIQIRVGLNSGDVVVRAIGSDLHMDYTAIGQTTHLAARMEQMATPGTILLAAATLQLAEGYVQVMARGPVAVRGFPEPVEIYALSGASTERSRLQVAAARGLTHFVGREVEIGLLHRSVDLARSGHGQVVAIVGEPGVGKSRLFYELAHSHRTRDWLIVESRSVSYGKTTPYVPIIDLLKAYFGVETRDDRRRVRERIVGRILTLDRALEPELPALLALLDLPVDDAAWEAADAVQRRQRTHDAVKRVLLAEARVHPVLAIIEDLHWIDGETAALLDGLIDSLPTARFLLLVNYRPEYQHAWGSKTYYTQLRLDALPPESADALLLALLGADATVEPLRPILIARTGGNPLFLEECVRTFVETNVLVGERGAYRLSRLLDTIAVPATVQAILASRIDRLDSQDKKLLQTSSVVGKDVPFALLLAIAELPEEDLRRGLARLQAAEFLYEVNLFPDLEYTFKHALTHDVAYEGVLHERRRALHARIVAAIETRHQDRLSEHTERLAHHALRGELREKAVHYLREAGLKADARSSLRDAQAWFEQALGVLEMLPQSQSALEQAFEIRLELRRVLNQLGEVQRALERLSEAEILAHRLNDDRRRGLVWASLANILSQVGEPDEALAYGTRALEIARRLGDLRLRITTTTNLAQANYFLGEYERAAELANDNLIAFPSDWVRESLGRYAPGPFPDRMFLIINLSLLGRFAEAAEHVAEMIRLAELTRHPFTVGQAQGVAGTLHLLKGEWAEAQFPIERGLAMFRTGNAGLLLPLAVALSAWALAQVGEATEAVIRLREGEQLLEHQEASGHTSNRGWTYHWLGRASLLLGRLDYAQSLGERAVDSSSRQPGFMAHALHLLGDIATYPNRFDAERAEAYYRHALALAEPRGMRPLVAHCHLGLGKLYRRTGKREEAQEHLTTATTMYREMGMTYWLEQAEELQALT